MKFSKLYKFLIVLPVVSMLGCADFLDVNDTPNNPLAPPPATMLGAALGGTAFANANELNRFASTVTSYLSGAGGSPQSYDRYILTGGDFGNQWNGELFNGSLITYKKMIDAADEIGAKSYSGVGKIMMAYTFALTTDIWGDIPYSQALQGDQGADEILRPALDLQEDIYKGNSSKGIKSLFDLLREGIADLAATSTTNPGTEDIVYGGNLANWRKAGYSVMLKLAMTISGREPALAASVINEVLAADYIKANTENLSVRFGGSVGSQSPIYTWTYVSLFINDLIVSTRYVALLNSLADPRLPLFVTRTSAGAYVTIDNGFAGTLPTPTSSWSRWAPPVVGASGVGPIRLITYASRCFMMAEAAVMIPGVTLPAGMTAQSLYYEGMRASMSEAGMTAAQMDAYLGTAAAPTAVATLSGTQANMQQQIITQKYIALTGNGLEAWNDYRRTGFPVLAQHQNAAGEDGTRPVRARYLDSEIARNPNFIAKKTNERVWWDVN